MFLLSPPLFSSLLFSSSLSLVVCTLACGLCIMCVNGLVALLALNGFVEIRNVLFKYSLNPVLFHWAQEVGLTKGAKKIMQRMEVAHRKFQQQQLVAIQQKQLLQEVEDKRSASSTPLVAAVSPEAVAVVTTVRSVGVTDGDATTPGTDVSDAVGGALDLSEVVGMGNGVEAPESVLRSILPEYFRKTPAPPTKSNTRGVVTARAATGAAAMTTAGTTAGSVGSNSGSIRNEVLSDKVYFTSAKEHKGKAASGGESSSTITATPLLATVTTTANVSTPLRSGPPPANPTPPVPPLKCVEVEENEDEVARAEAVKKASTGVSVLTIVALFRKIVMKI
jgi:hypothetical protein